MQSQLTLQGYGGDYLIQPSSAVMEQYYHHQQDISPGSAGIPSPTDSCCTSYQMGMPMPQPNGYPPMQAMGMFPSSHLQLTPGHSLRQRDFLRCRRKGDLAGMGFKSHPTAVARRNERERNRVKHINGTFSTLRQHLPSGSKNKKMSKVETLRSAIRYINHLQRILDAQDDEQDSTTQIERPPRTTQSPHSTSTEDCLDTDKKCSVSSRDSDMQLNSSGSSSGSTDAADRPCSPDSSNRLPKNIGQTECSRTTQGESAPVSPSYSSTRSIDSPVPSGCSSSDDAGYDTYATTGDDNLAELVNWLE